MSFYFAFRVCLESVPSLISRFHRFNFTASVLQRNCSTSISKTLPFPTSALYVSGRKAENMTSILSPDLDLDIFNDLQTLERNLRARRACIDVSKLAKEWVRFTELKNKKAVLKKQRGELTTRIRNMPEEERSQFNETLNKIKDEWQAVSREVWDMEEDFVLQVLNLPNSVLKITPLGNEQVLYVHKDKPVFNFPVKSHIELGENSQDLQLSSISPTAYYLKNSIAKAELTCQEYFRKKFERSHFSLLSSPDTFRPVVIEGCGKDFLNLEEVLLLTSREDQRIENCNSLHLEGSAGLAAFCAFHTKTIIKKIKSLPVKYISVGRCYQTLPELEDYSFGLFNSLQSTKVQFFIGTENKYSYMIQEYEKVIELIKSIYKEIDIHFRIVQKPVFALCKTDSLETSFEMWSPFLQSYIQIGRICISGDYISKRLLCQYENNGESKYLNMVHGTAVTTVHLLACIMENTQTAEGSYMLQYF